MAVTGIGTYASYTNSYGNTQNAGNKTGRTYKNAHEYKNYLTQKYDCLRSRDYSVNINSSLLSEAMGDEKTKQWLEYNLSLIPKTIEQSRAYVAARGAKILSYSITINGYDSMSSVMCTQDEVDPGTSKEERDDPEHLAAQDVFQVADLELLLAAASAPAVETQLFVQFAVHEGEDHERQQADQQQHGAECHRSYDRCGSHVGEPRRNGEDGENADTGNGHLKPHGQSHLLAFEPLGYGF